MSQEENEAVEALIASLPTAVREAFEAQNVEAFTAALEALPETEREDILQRLQAGGVIRAAHHHSGGDCDCSGDSDCDCSGDGPEVEAVVASLPPSVRAAVEAGDVEQLATALEAFPQAEQHDILRQLRDAGIIAGGVDAELDAVMASLPEAIRVAIESDDMEKLKDAMDALPEEEQRDILERLHEAGLLGSEDDPDPESVLGKFDPLLQAIAVIALAENDADLPEDLRAAIPEMRPRVENDLEQLEQQGWGIRSAAERIWAGERDAAELTAGLDEQDALLVDRILELIASQSGEDADA